MRLRVQGRYSRAGIEAAYCCAEALRLRDPARRRPLDPPRRCALARTQPDRPAVRDPQQERSPLLPLHPLPRPGPRPVPLPLGKPEHHHRRLPHRSADIHHEARGSRVLLYCFAKPRYVREHRREGGRARGVTEPFRCLGCARYESHEGERPMAIRWRLERPIPAGWMQGMGWAV